MMQSEREQFLEDELRFEQECNRSLLEALGFMLYHFGECFEHDITLHDYHIGRWKLEDDQVRTLYTRQADNWSELFNEEEFPKERGSQKSDS